MKVRALGVCVALAAIGAGSPAAAEEASATVARFEDELPEAHEAARLEQPTDARTEPSDAGKLVASLPRGAIVTRLATRGEAELVAFDDPVDPSRTTFGWVPVKAFTASAVAARALDARPPRPKVVPSRSWYGWQTLLVDGAAAVVIVASTLTLGNGNDLKPFWATVGIGLTTYGLGAPLVHGLHGNVDAGFGSAALRLVVGGLGFFSVAVFAGTGVFYPGLAVALVAPVIDATVLAYETVPAAASTKRTRLNPTVAPTNGGATLGLAGSF